MRWENDWPLIGEDYDNNGIGEPVLTHTKPNTGKDYREIVIPITNDEFDSETLGLQWQWQSLFEDNWISLKERNGWLRFFSQTINKKSKNFWDASSLMMQKFPVPNFSTITKLESHFYSIGEKSGLIVFGFDYAYLSIEKTEYGYKISNIVCEDANQQSEEKIIEEMEYTNNTVYLKVDVRHGLSKEGIPEAICNFHFSDDGIKFKSIGKDFTAKAGRWVGAKVGIFSLSKNKSDEGYTDFDWFRFE